MATHERGLSPVVGIALFVVITILLAATVAAFALDLGQSQSADGPWSEPDAEFSVTDARGAGVVVEHVGGDALQADRLSVNGDDWPGEGTVSESDSVVVEVEGDVEVVWSDGARRVVLAEWSA